MKAKIIFDGPDEISAFLIICRYAQIYLETNQDNNGKQIFTEEGFDKIHQKMNLVLKDTIQDTLTIDNEDIVIYQQICKLGYLEIRRLFFKKIKVFPENTYEEIARICEGITGLFSKAWIYQAFWGMKEDRASNISF